MSHWSSKSIASSFQHQIFYWAIRMGKRPIAYFMLAFVVFWYTLTPKVRKRSYPYISRRFPKTNLLGKWLHAYRLNLSFGLNLVDRAALGILDDIEFTADDKDKTLISELLAKGHGVILLTAHVGSWQTAFAALDFLDRPQSVVLHRAQDDVDQQYFEHRPGGSPVSIIDPMGPLGGSLEMLDVLRRGEVLCISGDRVMGSDRNVVTVNFLDDPIAVPMSVYRLASLTGAPVVVVFSKRIHGKHIHIWLETTITVPVNLDNNTKTYTLYAQKYIRGLENFVMEHPYHYFNFFNIWNNEN